MAPGCSDWQHVHDWQIPWEVILRLIRLTHTLIHSVQAGKGATVRTVQNGGRPKYTSSFSCSRSTTGWNQFEVTFITVLLRRNLNDKWALGAGTGSGQKLSTTWHRCSASAIFITHLHNSVGLGDAGFSLGAACHSVDTSCLMHRIGTSSLRIQSSITNPHQSLPFLAVGGMLAALVPHA